MKVGSGTLIWERVVASTTVGRATWRHMAPICRIERTLSYTMVMNVSFQTTVDVFIFCAEID